MQRFVNLEWIDRAGGEVFDGPRARYYLVAAIAATTATAAGLALGAIWLGLVLLVEETRAALLRRLPRDGTRFGHIALDCARAAAFATAPAMAWFSRIELGQALALLTLAALMAPHALFAQRGARQAALSALPYGVVAIAFLIDAALQGAFAAAAAGTLMLGFMFTAMLQVARAKAHRRREDAAFSSEFNAVVGGVGTAIWECDIGAQALEGGAALSALLGRSVSYQSLLATGCFASPEDRSLAQATFTAASGRSRRFALEHWAVDGAGAPMRLRHHGWISAAPDGRPLRLICITRRLEGQAASARAGALLSHTLAMQGETLRTLANELNASPAAPLGHAEQLSFADGLAAVATQCELIGDRVDALARARHNADAANLAKSQFLTGMSHELRTPLNAIIGYSEILLEDAADKGDTATTQDLGRILNAAKHLMSLIGEILDLSKIEAGRMDVAPSTFHPGELISEAIETMTPAAELNRNRLRFVGAPPSDMAATDALKIRQCLLNLLSNACKFTEAGDIEVSYDTRMHSGVPQMFFEVRDTGIGISSAQMERLFQPFVQADPTIARRYGGTGLGLTITRRLAQLLGGDVQVESVLGQGARFTLHAPLAYADAAKARGAAAPIDVVQGPEGAPLVIVIEDESDARELAARALTRAGFAVLGVGGGEAGLTLTRERAPALVLLDIYLPDRSGWRILQALKHDPRTLDIPVIVVSVNDDRAHALALGAAEHITKPFDRDRLAATVMRYARHRPAAPAQLAEQVRQKTG